MTLSNYLSDVITQTDYAVVEGEKRKAVLRIVHGRSGYHVLLVTGTLKLYTSAFPDEVTARVHALACTANLWRVAQSRTAGLEELVEAVLSGA